MSLYDVVASEWVHLGLYDLLDASRGTPYPPWMPTRLRLDAPAAGRFYWWAMDIAKAGRVVTSSSQDG